MTQLHEAETTAPASRRTVLIVSLLALAVSLFILFAAVLPAQFGRDPTGLGRLTGIGALHSPTENVVAATNDAGAPATRSFPTPFRSDVIDIPLKTGDATDGSNDVEYKVRLEKGASYIYSWEVPGVTDPEEFYTEFHGHTVEQGKEMTVSEYRKATGAVDNGVLTAPFAGVHGWYFQNQGVKPVTVRLKLAGFYTLVPAGQPGNEAGLQARPAGR